MAPDHPAVCRVSEQCRSAVGVVRALGVPASETRHLSWCWAHLGPIAPEDCRVALHRDGSGLLDWRPIPAGYLADFRGYHLDALGLRHRPPFLAATYNLTLGLWLVYAVAGRGADEPYLEWSATASGPGRTRKCYDDQPVTADADGVLDHCLDLVMGRTVRRGRRRHTEAELAAKRAVVERVEALMRGSARRTYKQACGLAGVPESTFRDYRRLVSRWHCDDAAATARREA